MAHTAHTDHFANFAEFYPYYLSEHRNVVSRRLHFVGSLGVIGCLAMALATGDWLWLPAAVVCGYGFGQIVAVLTGVVLLVLGLGGGVGRAE